MQRQKRPFSEVVCFPPLEGYKHRLDMSSLKTLWREVDGKDLKDNSTLRFYDELQLTSLLYQSGFPICIKQLLFHELLGYWDRMMSPPAAYLDCTWTATSIMR